jgi:16S rRNA (guanine966-N2)-methyltransferase
MKESMFSALGGACRGATVLDLFAGSGALGFEALSRGAAQATFVEQDPTVREVLAANARALGLENVSQIVGMDVFAYLRTLGENDFFDLIFADPPFQARVTQELLAWWKASSHEGSLLILEYSSLDRPPAGDDKIEIIKSAAFGESSYSIFLAR